MPVYGLCPTGTTLFLTPILKRKTNFRRNFFGLLSLSFLSDAKKYMNTYTIKNPLKCKVVNIVKLTKEKAKNEVYHVEIHHDQKFKYVEGQSCGIIPYFSDTEEEIGKQKNETKNETKNGTQNGTQNETQNETQNGTKNGTQNETQNETQNKTQQNKTKKKARLYSISSSNSKYLSVAVKIHKYYEKEKNGKEIEKYGYCSEFIKNLKKGENIFLTGSHGKFLLPENIFQTNQKLIFVGTGTGISPFVSFLIKLFGNDENCEKNEDKKNKKIFEIKNEKNCYIQNKKKLEIIKNEKNCNIQNNKILEEKKKKKIPNNINENKTYKGVINLYYGIHNEDSILYLDKLQEIKKKHPDNLFIHYVFSSPSSSSPSSSSSFSSSRNKWTGINSDTTTNSTTYTDANCSFYVQDEISRMKEKFLNLFYTENAELYICGHTNIKNRIVQILKDSEKYDEKCKKKVHVEVY